MWWLGVRKVRRLDYWGRTASHCSGLFGRLWKLWENVLLEIKHYIIKENAVKNGQKLIFFQKFLWAYQCIHVNLHFSSRGLATSFPLQRVSRLHISVPRWFLELGSLPFLEADELRTGNLNLFKRVVTSYVLSTNSPQPKLTHTPKFVVPMYCTSFRLKDLPGNLKNHFLHWANINTSTLSNLPPRQPHRPVRSSWKNEFLRSVQVDATVY